MWPEKNFPGYGTRWGALIFGKSGGGRSNFKILWLDHEIPNPIQIFLTKAGSTELGFRTLPESSKIFVGVTPPHLALEAKQTTRRQGGGELVVEEEMKVHELLNYGVKRCQHTKMLSGSSVWGRQNRYQAYWITYYILVCAETILYEQKLTNNWGTLKRKHCVSDPTKKLMRNIVSIPLLAFT